MKVVIVVLSLLSLVSETHAFGSRRSSGVGSPSATPAPVGTPIPNADLGTGGLRVEIRQSDDFNSEQLAKLLKARELLERVVNSEEFKQKVLHFTYGGQETYVQNNGLTNLQIYNLLMGGAEEYPVRTQANNAMDLFTKIYTSNWLGRNTVGYTTQGESTIYMNSRHYNYFEPSSVAGNMIHEWIHKMGFDHDSSATARRPSSVPYAIGYIAEAMAEKLQ